MKPILLSLFSAALLSSAAFASDDVILNAKSLVEVSNESKILEIKEARATLSVSSTGSRLRPDCFKEYKTNFPFSPQTVSYTVEANLPVKLEKNTMKISDVVKKTESFTRELKKKLNLGCSSEASMIILVEGQTTKGSEFKSDLQVFVTKEGIKVQTGALSQVVTPETAKTIDLVSTVLFGDTWNDVWSDLDPANFAVRKNY